MATFQVIRVSSDYEVVVVVSPAGAKPWSEDLEYWHRNDAYSEKALEFTGISAKKALGYFSGHADGIGWGQMPEKEFTSLTAVEEWRKKVRADWVKKQIAKYKKRD